MLEALTGQVRKVGRAGTGKWWRESSGKLGMCLEVEDLLMT